MFSSNNYISKTDKCITIVASCMIGQGQPHHHSRSGECASLRRRGRLPVLCRVDGSHDAERWGRGREEQN
jgi:ribosomal protein L36